MQQDPMKALCVIAWLAVALSFGVVYVLDISKTLCFIVLMTAWAMVFICMFVYWRIKKKAEKKEHMVSET